MTTTLLWLCTVAWVPIPLADDTEPTGETPAEEPAAEEAPEAEEEETPVPEEPAAGEEADGKDSTADVDESAETET